MPVPTLSTRKLGSSRLRRHSSASAIRLTSLSTQTGASYSARRSSRIEKLSHCGISGGSTSWPVAKSTGPGTPMPIARTSRGLRLQPASSSRINARMRDSTRPGPMRTSIASPWRASTCRSSDNTATSMLVAPRSAHSSTPSDACRHSVSARRPPDDSRWPDLSSQPCSTRPAITALACVRENASRCDNASRDGPCSQKTPSSTLNSLSDSCAQRVIVSLSPSLPRPLRADGGNVGR